MYSTTRLNETHEITELSPVLNLDSGLIILLDDLEWPAHKISYKSRHE